MAAAEAEKPGGGPAAGLGSMRKASANRNAAGGRWRRRAGTQGPGPGKSYPLLPPVQTKQGRERARWRAPEEASTRGAGG